jgi:hypothetical protein
VDGLERPELRQLAVDLGAHEVARVEDQVGRRQLAKALLGQLPRPTRHVRVGDDRDERQRAGAGFGFFFAGVPTWNARPTKVDVRVGFISAVSRRAKT